MTRLKASQLPGELVFESESAFRKAAKKKLEEAGFEVYAISVNGKLKSQLSGLGDLHIRRPDWERGIFIKVELKNGNEDWSSDEQEEDYYAGKFELFRWIIDVDDFIRRN